MSRVGHEDSSSFISSQQQRFTVFSSAPLYSCDAMLFRTFQCKIKRWRLVHSAALLNFQAHSRGELRTSAEQLSVCSVRSGPVLCGAERFADRCRMRVQRTRRECKRSASPHCTVPVRSTQHCTVRLVRQWFSSHLKHISHTISSDMSGFGSLLIAISESCRAPFLLLLRTRTLKLVSAAMCCALRIDFRRSFWIRISDCTLEKRLTCTVPALCEYENVSYSYDELAFSSRRVASHHMAAIGMWSLNWKVSRTFVIESETLSEIFNLSFPGTQCFFAVQNSFTMLCVRSSRVKRSQNRK